MDDRYYPDDMTDEEIAKYILGYNPFFVGDDVINGGE